MSMDYAERKQMEMERRQAVLRFGLLQCAEIGMTTSPTGFLPAERMYRDAGMFDRFVDEAECILLLRQLVKAGYLEEKLRMPVEGDRLRLRHLRYQITNMGIALVNHRIGQDPLIADGRQTEE